jgi:acetaldehyde dehydrogenase / alcohol dehydrogenase
MMSTPSTHVTPTPVDTLVANATKALAEAMSLTQDDVDHIVKKASVAALDQHGVLALHAVAETGRGVFEDKAVKSIFACEHVTNSMAALHLRLPRCALHGRDARGHRPGPPGREVR